MSTTQLFYFNEDGTAEFLGETANSFRGAAAVRSALESKYLPKNFYPGSHIEISRCVTEKGNKEIDDLFYNADSGLTTDERIVLALTFTGVVVLKKYLQRVIDAFESFDESTPLIVDGKTIPTSLKDQAKLLKAVLNDPDVVAVAFNASSVDCDGRWDTMVIDDEDDEHEYPYNIFEYNDHFLLSIDGDKVSVDKCPQTKLAERSFAMASKEGECKTVEWETVMEDDGPCAFFLKIDANSMKQFFHVMQNDITNRCVLPSPCDLKGQACMIEACPYNGICELAYKMSDALIEHVVEVMHD